MACWTEKALSALNCEDCHGSSDTCLGAPAAGVLLVPVLTADLAVTPHSGHISDNYHVCHVPPSCALQTTLLIVQ